MVKSIATAFFNWLTGGAFFTIRLKQNGIIDSTYGNNGTVITTNSLSQISFALAIQNDDKIIVGGLTTINNTDSSF